MALDKVSFLGKLTLLSSATSDDAQPTPGYMFPAICQITYQSGGQNQDLIDWLEDRLASKSCYSKSKVLRIMKYLVNHGHPDFRQGLRKRSQRISEAIKYSGPPHQLHGNALYLQVRQDAKELSELLFIVSENDSGDSITPSTKQPAGFGMGSSGRGRLEGFGSTQVVLDKSVGDSIIDGLRDLAQRVVDLTSDPRSDMTFVPSSSSSLIPGYRPAAVPDAETSVLDLNKSLPQPSGRKSHKRHIRGVAGGGWDDEDAGAKLSGSSQGTPNRDEEKCSSTGDHDVTSFGTDKVESDISKSDDCSSERQLVNALVFCEDNNELIPSRDNIQNFVTSCSRVNCEKMIELICTGLDPLQMTHSMIPSIVASSIPGHGSLRSAACGIHVIPLNGSTDALQLLSLYPGIVFLLIQMSMLLLEALLRTDLVSPDFVAITCGHHLLKLFTNTSADNRVQQKARKIIRILEKLAPNQSSIFCDIVMENKNADAVVQQGARKTARNDCTINSLPINSAKEDDGHSASTSAFPFLSFNSSMLS